MTNIIDFETRSTIEGQAREWLIRLDGDNPLGDAELADLREWVGRSSVHREELTRISKFWNQANVLTELAVPLDRQNDRNAGHSRQRLRANVVAASGLIASTLLIAWWFGRTDGADNGTYGTAIGQQQTVSLPDGSSIQLNTDSQVQVNYSQRLRRIRLLRGEALFAVVPDKHRKFDVYAGDGVVTAVGTAFSVHLEGNKVDVTVTKGIVDVAEVGGALTATRAESNNARTTLKLGRLKAGETTTFGAQTQQINVRELAESELRRRMAWHEGYLVFSGEPLSEVVEQVNRYSPVTLHIADPKLASIAVGGRFRIGDLDAVLEVLRANFGIQSSRIGERDIELGPAVPR
jgi:transmembrane sensor